MDIMPAISTMSLIRIYIACYELAISFKTHFCCRLACVNLAAFYLNTLFCWVSFLLPRWVTGLLHMHPVIDQSYRCNCARRLIMNCSTCSEITVYVFREHIHCDFWACTTITVYVFREHIQCVFHVCRCGSASSCYVYVNPKNMFCNLPGINRRQNPSTAFS